MSKNQSDKIDNISGDGIKQQLSGSLSRPQDSIREVVTTPRPDRSTVKKAPDKPQTKHTKEIIAVAVVLGVIIAAGLRWLYKVSMENESEIETELYSEETSVESIDPIVNLLTELGTIKLTGILGAVPTTFEMNFNTQEGVRYYTSTPMAKYVVKLRHADINEDGTYHIVLTDYLEGRVAIGRFDGILSSDGTVFTGEYVSSHSKVREFKFER